jgi:hypothetical protein
MQADPAGYAGGSLNQYQYCNNCPLISVDEYGCFAETAAAGTTAAAQGVTLGSAASWGGVILAAATPLRQLFAYARANWATDCWIPGQYANTPFPGLPVSNYGSNFDALTEAMKFVVTKHEEVHQRSIFNLGEEAAMKDSWIRIMELLHHNRFGGRELTGCEREELELHRMHVSRKLEQTMDLKEYYAWMIDMTPRIGTGEYTWFGDF